jgi:hypothetical protein
MFKTVAGVQEALTQKQPPVFCSWEDNHISMEDQTIDLKLPKFRHAGILYSIFNYSSVANSFQNISAISS